MHTQTFVAQCDEDYRLLNQLVSDTTEALGKTVRITTWFRPADGNIAPPPMTPEEVRCARLFYYIQCAAHIPLAKMREIGFDGYAIDFVDCPPAMRSYLTRDCQFHRTVSATRTAYILIIFANSRRACRV